MASLAGFFNSIVAGDLAAITRGINDGIDVNSRDGPQFGKTPLHVAVDRNHLDVARLLLDKGSTVNLADKMYGKTPLHYAMTKNTTEFVDLLVEYKADVNARDRNGDTPLHCAAENGRTVTIERLLDHHADIDARNEFNESTPLHRTAQYGYIETARILLTRGANIKLFDSVEKTPLHVAAENGHDGMVKLLITNGASMNVRDEIYGRTPLHYAAKNMHKGVLAVLLENGAHVNSRDKEYGNTALHHAAEKGSADLVTALLQKGAHVNSHDREYGNTAMHWATGNGHVEVVQILLDNGADINACDKLYGKTVLHWAVEYGRANVTKLLLDKGAKMTGRDVLYGRTPLHWAVCDGNAEIVSLFLDHAADTNVKDKNGRPLIHDAAACGCLDVIQLLLRKGVDVNARDDMFQRTAFHEAAKEGYVDVINELLQGGADPNAVDLQGHSAFNMAMSNAIVDLLEINTRFGRNASNFVYQVLNCNDMGAVVPLQAHLYEIITKKGNDNNNTSNLPSSPSTQSLAIPLSPNNSSSSSLKWSKPRTTTNKKTKKRRIEQYFVKEYNPRVNEWTCLLQTLRTCITSYKQSPTFHIHLIGPAKAGKTVAVQWLLKMLPYELSSLGETFDRLTTSSKVISVEHGRTRGIEIHSIWGKDSFNNPLHFLIHDYGGQNEFLLSHPNTLTIENSIYMIIIPMYEMLCDHNGKQRNYQDIIHDYDYWLKFIYSMIRKTLPMKAIVVDIDDDDDCNNINNNNDNSTVCSDQTMKTENHSKYIGPGIENSVTTGIPLITVLNKFSKVHKNGVSDESIAQVSELMQKTLLEQFRCQILTYQDSGNNSGKNSSKNSGIDNLEDSVISRVEGYNSNPNKEQIDFVMPSIEPILVNAITKHGVSRIQRTLIDFITTRLLLRDDSSDEITSSSSKSTTSGMNSSNDHNNGRSTTKLSPIASWISGELAAIWASNNRHSTSSTESSRSSSPQRTSPSKSPNSTKPSSNSSNSNNTLRWLVRKETWIKWLTNKISQYNIIKMALTRLSTQFKQILLDIIIKHCHDILLQMNDIVILQEDLHGCNIVTNPSLLASAVMGDIFYWYFKRSKIYHEIQLQQQLAITTSSITSIQSPSSKTSKTLKLTPSKSPSKSPLNSPLNSPSTPLTPSTGTTMTCKKCEAKKQSLSTPIKYSKGSKQQLPAYQYHFHDIHAVRLTVEQIGHIFEDVYHLYQEYGITDNATAHELLMPYGGVQSFPIIDLLVRMKLCVPITSTTSNGGLESWLIGLEPNKPMNQPLLVKIQDLPPKLNDTTTSDVSDNTSSTTSSSRTSSTTIGTSPMHWISRYYRLPNDKSIFFPGYFMRLFIFLYQRYSLTNHNNGNNIEIWSDAINIYEVNYEQPYVCERQVMIEVIKKPSTVTFGTTNGNIDNTNDNIPSHLQSDGFLVTVICKARNETSIKQAVIMAYDEMNYIRTFIHRHMWGLELVEYCLPVDRRVNSSSRVSKDGYPLSKVEQQLCGIISIADQVKEGVTVADSRIRAQSLYFGLLRRSIHHNVNPTLPINDSNSNTTTMTSSGVITYKWESVSDIITQLKLPLNVNDYTISREDIVNGDLLAMAMIMKSPMESSLYLRSVGNTNSIRSSITSNPELDKRKALLQLLRRYYLYHYMKKHPIHTQLTSLATTSIITSCKYDGITISEFDNLFKEIDIDDDNHGINGFKIVNGKLIMMTSKKLSLSKSYSRQSKQSLSVIKALTLAHSQTYIPSPHQKPLLTPPPLPTPVPPLPQSADVIDELSLVTIDDSAYDSTIPPSIQPFSPPISPIRASPGSKITPVQDYLQQIYPSLHNIGVFDVPLFITLEKIKYSIIGASYGDKLMTIARKDYWQTNTNSLSNSINNSSGGSIYVVKFLCQVCGRVPSCSTTTLSSTSTSSSMITTVVKTSSSSNNTMFNGMKIFKMYSWARRTLKILRFSLHLLEYALTVAGMPDSVCAIEDSSVQVFGQDIQIMSQLVHRCVTAFERFYDDLEENGEDIFDEDIDYDDYSEFVGDGSDGDMLGDLQAMRVRLQEKLDMWEANMNLIASGGLASPTSPTSPVGVPVRKTVFKPELSTVNQIKESQCLITRDYLEAIQELFKTFPQCREECGLIKVSRLDGDDIAWVCKEGSSCRDCFERTGRVLLRYKVNTSS